VRTGTGTIDIQFLDVDSPTVVQSPTTVDVLAIMEHEKLRPPDRAEAESFFDAYPEEAEQHLVVALCGSVTASASGPAVACFTLHPLTMPDRVIVDCRWRLVPLTKHWDPYRRFVAVRLTA
jgi:hypothetical protein